jgi:hypothetical protein
LVAGALPAEVQAIQGAADGLAGDLNPMMVRQVLAKQRGRPHRGVVAERARVVVEHRGDQGVDDPLSGGRAARARGVGQACPEVQVAPLTESSHPVVDRLSAGAEKIGDLFDGVALAEPKQGLGAAMFLGKGELEQGCQLRSLVLRESKGSHGFTPVTEAGYHGTGTVYLSKNFWPLT